MRTKPTLILVLIALTLGLGVAACGQKGDLYLPAENDKKSTSENG